MDIWSSKPESWFGFVVDRLASIGHEVAGLAVGAMVVLITIDVFMRYVLNSPSMWIDEFSGYLLVSVVFLGLGCTQKAKGHIRVDLLVSKLPKRFRQWIELLNLITFLIFVAILFALTWRSFILSVSYGTTSNTIIDIPLAPIQVLIPMGLLLVGLVLLLDIYRQLKAIWGQEDSAGTAGSD